MKDIAIEMKKKKAVAEGGLKWTNTRRMHVEGGDAETKIIRAISVCQRGRCHFKHSETAKLSQGSVTCSLCAKTEYVKEGAVLVGETLTSQTSMAQQSLSLTAQPCAPGEPSRVPGPTCSGSKGTGVPRALRPVPPNTAPWCGPRKPELPHTPSRVQGSPGCWWGPTSPTASEALKPCGLPRRPGTQRPTPPAPSAPPHPAPGPDSPGTQPQAPPPSPTPPCPALPVQSGRAGPRQRAHPGRGDPTSRSVLSTNLPHPLPTSALPPAPLATPACPVPSQPPQHLPQRHRPPPPLPACSADWRVAVAMGTGGGRGAPWEL